MSEIHVHTYSNGLILLAEPMIGVQSLAMSMMLPAGCASEPADQLGVSSVLSEMLFRGAGELDSRQHSDALDLLGIHRTTEIQTHHMRLGATMLADRLKPAAALLLDTILRPTLPAEEFEPCQDLAVQAIDGLEDEPQQKVMIELKSRHLPDPFGRSNLGQKVHLQSLNIDKVRYFWQNRFVPTGSILSFAGKLEWEPLRDLIGKLTEKWSGKAPEAVELAPPVRGSLHIHQPSAQQHIGLAYDAVPETHPESMTQRIASGILAGGMSGRLFTEVREKRGLCYAVYAAYAAGRDRGMMIAYSGTTNERAAQTLEVLIHELRKLADGVAPDEFERALIGLKSRLVMQGESTSARAGAIGTDQYIFGHPRGLQELEAEIDSVDISRLNRFLRENPPGPFTLLTVGPEPLATAQ